MMARKEYLRELVARGDLTEADGARLESASSAVFGRWLRLRENMGLGAAAREAMGAGGADLPLQPATEEARQRLTAVMRAEQRRDTETAAESKGKRTLAEIDRDLDEAVKRGDDVAVARAVSERFTALMGDDDIEDVEALDVMEV